jgi:hypothetical protein
VLLTKCGSGSACVDLAGRDVGVADELFREGGRRDGWGRAESRSASGAARPDPRVGRVGWQGRFPGQHRGHSLVGSRGSSGRPGPRIEGYCTNCSTASEPGGRCSGIVASRQSIHGRAAISARSRNCISDSEGCGRRKGQRKEIDLGEGAGTSVRKLASLS